MLKLPIGVVEGEVLAEKYRIGNTLGAGAMGVVVSARHLLLDQKVAIKFLVPRAHDHPSSVTRFLREARATARLKSEHVVRVLDVDVLEGGIPYIVMEFLEGCDLAEWLRRRRVLRPDEACDVILQACDAVHEAHSLDIIHRDLKPPNLFVVHDESVVQTIKVLDFGISKMIEAAPSTVAPYEWSDEPIVTEDRMPIGSPHYMSPEQMESARDVDARTDVWSLGVTLYELVTGRLPFEGTSLLQVHSKIAAQTPGHLRASLVGVPPGVVDVILRCLERNRERRFRSVSEFAMALVAYGSNRAPTYIERIARSGPRGAGAPSSATPSLLSLRLPDVGKTLSSPIYRRPSEAARGEQRSARGPLILGAIAVLVLAVWASASWRASSTASGPASLGTAAHPSPPPIVPDLESPRPEVIGAAPPAAITSFPTVPERTEPKRVDVRERSPAPRAVDFRKAPAPSLPTPNAGPDAAPPPGMGSAATDREWVPPDSPK